MMESEQYEPWQAASIGFISQTLRAYDSNPVWSADPQHLFFRDMVRETHHVGYAGRLGKSRPRCGGLRRRGHVRGSVHRPADAQAAAERAERAHGGTTGPSKFPLPLRA